MKDGSPHHYTIADGVDGRRNFTSQHVREIIAVTGKSVPASKIRASYIIAGEVVHRPVDRLEYLEKCLNGSAATYFSLCEAVKARGPSPSQKATQLDGIAKTTARLWRQLHLHKGQNADDLPDFPKYELRQAAARRFKKLSDLMYLDQLASTINAILDLNAMATDAANIARSRITKDRDRNPGDEARRILIERLWISWFDVFNEVPKSSFDVANEKPASPFLSFCVAVIRRLGLRGRNGRPLTVAAVHKQIQSVEAKPPRNLIPAGILKTIRRRGDAKPKSTQRKI